MSSAAAGFSSSDASVYEIELFLRIDKDAFGAKLFAVFKNRYSDLADAPHSRIRRLSINRHKFMHIPVLPDRRW